MADAPAPPQVTVLNVNDDAATRYMMTSILRKAGFEVLEAATGEDALRTVMRDRPELVLLDIKLPDVNGLEVCRRLKANPSTASTLIVQTSATFSSSVRKIQGLDSGADAYLVQPIEPLELVATVRAVLRTRQAEERERRAARKLQRTFEAIQDAVLMLDAYHRVERWNQAAERLLGIGPARLVGAELADVLSDFGTREDLAMLSHGASGRRELEGFVRGRHYRVSADPVVDDDGSAFGVVVIVSDVSETKRLAEELRRRADELAEAARRKDEFLGMLAHELRNPLNAISAANTVLGRSAQADANGVRLHSIISRHTGTLARLIDDLLEVSRITRGQLSLRRRRVDLAQILRQAIQAAQAVAEVRKQILELHAPNALVLIDGDDLRLEQIILNLLNNATKYSEPHAKIRVTLTVVDEADESWAELRVTDDGIGIPADMLTTIFEPFVQVDQSLSRSLGGLGIGLTMVRSLVELHGGTVRAESAGLGKGASFTVRLPVARETQPTANALPGPASSSRMVDSTLSILVVEDNPDTRELVQTWLEMLGHSVQTAPDGKKGLELAMSMKPDLAMVDIGLPEIDGYEVAKTIRSWEDGRKIFMVAVTGYGRPEDRARALDAGFDTYLVKPIDDAALRKVLALVAPS